MAHKSIWTSDGLIRKFSGKITPDEILKSNLDLYSDPKFEKIKYIINDFTSIKCHTIDASHTKVYASTDDIISNTKGKYKIAIVVNENTNTHLANSYKNEMKNSYFKCEVFQSVEDAKEWVSL